MSDEWQEYLKDTRRICKYGVNCYQKNAEHQSKFKHPPNQKRKVDNKKKNNTRFHPYNRKEKDNVDKPEKDTDHDKEQEPSSSEAPETTASEKKAPKMLTAKNAVSDDIKNTSLSKIAIDKTTECFDKDSDNKVFKDCFLVEMPSDFFAFYKCLKSEEGSLEKLLSSVNLELIGPYDLLQGKLPIIDDKDMYLIHWRFYYDPPEFQAVLKKKGKSEYHIGYFRDSPNEEPVFLAQNNSAQDYAIKPIATNIFGAVYWYLQQEKKSSPFVSVACQKFMEKINKWAKELNYSLEEFNLKSRHSQTVCKSFHGAGIVVPYNKTTQLGYRSLAESDAKLRKLFKQFANATSQSEKDNILSELQPVMTCANIAVDECDFGTGLEAGIAMFCSGLKELEASALNHLSSVYPLLKRDDFSKIIQIHMKYRRKGPDMSIINA